MKDLQHEIKPKLAIVSSYDDLCGIAGYTRKVVEQLEADFDVEVFDLDQFFMRAKGGRILKEADAQILDMCRRFSDFDHVNLQLEYGTLGFYKRDILRRFQWLVDAAPGLTVTFHTILQQNPFPFDDFRRRLFRFELYNCYKLVSDHRTDTRFLSRIKGSLFAAQKTKRVNVVAHTRRDAKRMRHIDRFKNVYDHPLSFIGTEKAESIRATAHWRSFPSLRDLPDDAKVIGVFGFLGQYKGMHVAIKAMHHLPPNFHLAIFGGLHPQEIVKSDTVHPYVQRLMTDIRADQTLVDVLSTPTAGSAGAMVNINVDTPEQLVSSPLDLSARVHFLGSLSDTDLEAAVAGSDIVVLPYFEVGQSASGPMSLAIDLGARIVASRNQAFMQVEKYHPGRLSLFEVGNHLELAQRLLAEENRPKPTVPTNFNACTNAAMYRQAILAEVSENV